MAVSQLIGPMFCMVPGDNPTTVLGRNIREDSQGTSQGESTRI